MGIYLDNAATTALDTEVFNAMTPYLLEHYGNPSSSHSHGRDAKKAIEASRATIARLLNALPEEIIFTSGGTEADNMALLSAIKATGIDHVITTAFEHHAVLHTLNELQKRHKIRISYIKHDEHGNLDLKHLEYLLRTNTRNLVSVMQANNEIGNLNDIERIGELCEHYKALFHSDTVQTIGHYRHDVRKLKVHFLAASAHKFHGPKGIGFLYCRKGTPLSQVLHGGGQERSLRAGTENIPGIIGLAKALGIAYRDLEDQQAYVQNLKDELISQLTAHIPEIEFNGNSAIANKSLFTILSARFPGIGAGESLLRCLDKLGVSVSGGSACSAGASSHVLKALAVDPEKDTIRFSFSKFNTPAEIAFVAVQLAELYQTVAA
jgi:cysteine desulfurase